MKKILVPIDFSEASKSALKYALKLAAVNNARVDVLHVYSLFDATPERIIGSAYQNIVDPAVVAKNDVEKLINKLNKSIKVNVDVKIANGIPEVKIIETARKQKSDMIVIGRTGNNALQRLFLGSTVANVINDSNVPVLVIPKETKWKKIKRVVFTTDLSNDTLKHIHEATAFARYFNAELVFLYVDTGSALNSDQKMLEMTEKLRKKVKYDRVSGYMCSDLTVRLGLDSYFMQYKADVAIMVTHHYHFPQVIWKRSLTQKLSASFNIPLLALVEKK